MSTFIYLAGPIAECDQGEANDWRMMVSDKLRPFGIIGISPLRCEPLIGEKYGVTYQDPCFGTARAISSKNFMDVQRCDMTLAYMPKALNERRLSVGTICELAWATAFRKPTILVSDYEFLTEHPVIRANANWILATLPDALDVIIGVLKVYSNGR